MTDTAPAIITADERPEHAAEGTQVANPVRASVRTVVQALVVLVPLVNVAAGIVISYLNEQADLAVPGWAFVILNAVLAATSLIIGMVARLMANPLVNAWVTRTLPWLAPARHAR
jgi:ABC-type uncharacterized transport system permease subunit